jgi:hypothetical protein
MGVPQVGRNGQAVRGVRNSSRFILFGAFALAMSVVAVTTTVAQPDRGGSTPLLDLPAPVHLAAAYPLLTAPDLAAPDQAALVAASLQLPALLGQHSALVSDMTRGRIRSDPDLAQATNAAITKNTAELSGLIRALYGDAAATTFSQLWSGHVTAYFNYARGLSEKDTAVQTQSTAVINRFESDIATFFSKASGGKLPQAAADAVVRVHLGHLLHQADQYSAAEYPQANDTYRAAFTQGYDLGTALDGALLPASVVAVMKSPSWRLQSALDKILGEHVVLMVAAMRSAATNNPDFMSTAAAIDVNTRDLAGSIAALFGPAAGTRFGTIWADHVDALVSYSAALAKGDAAQRTAAMTKLAAFPARLAAFIAGVTRSQPAGAQLAAVLGSYSQQLTSQAEAFVQKDYTASHDLAYSTYQNVQKMVGGLARAFGLILGDKLPIGPVEAGRGGMAAIVEHR